MLLFGAVGDAYGAGFEFAEREIIDRENDLTHYRTHPRYQSIFAKYTDDTQMAIGLAELIISKKEWTAVNIADKFVEVFKRDVREGYASRFYQFLQSVENGQDFLDKIHPKSSRNGAAMRAYPLGIFSTEKEIIEKNEIQTFVTHQTATAKIASEAIALISHFFINKKGKKEEVLTYLADFQGRKWSADWQNEVSMNGIETVEAVLTILINENSLSSMLKKSVDFGGDVDTVASLSLAIGSQIDSVKQDLPNWLFETLENETFGRDYIIQLNKTLFSKNNE